MPAYASPDNSPKPTIRSARASSYTVVQGASQKAVQGSAVKGSSGRWWRSALIVGMSVLSCACGSTVTTSPGPDAANPQCAEVIAALHGSQNLAGLARHEVSGQSTAAWGEPAVILRCGVPMPPPSTEGCVSVNDVDWAGPRDPKANDRKYVTYGRSPAVEVYIPVGSSAAPHVVLNELGPIVKHLPASKSCI